MFARKRENKDLSAVWIQKKQKKSSIEKLFQRFDDC